VMNAAEARSLMRVRDQSGKLLVVAFPGSLSPQIRTAVQLLRSGDLGNLLGISATVWQDWGPNTVNTWRQEPPISGGGFLFDTGAHMLNTVVDLAGEEFIDVAAWLDNNHRPVETLGVVIGRLASGAMVTLHGCGEAIASCDSDVRVFCSTAILRTGIWGERLELQRAGREGQGPDQAGRGAEGHRGTVHGRLQDGVQEVAGTRMTEHFAEELGLYYRTNTFAPGRPTLVFVHGLSGSSSTWLVHEAMFESRFNLLSYDLRGHGKSRRYPRYRDYEIPRFADDLKALLDHLAIDQCVLISHSYAVLIALEFLRVHQARVEGAVFLSGAYAIGRSLPAKVLTGLLSPIVLQDALPFHPGPGRHIDYAQYPDSGDWNMRRIVADARNTTWRAWLCCTKQAFAADPLVTFT